MIHRGEVDEQFNDWCGVPAQSNNWGGAVSPIVALIVPKHFKSMQF